MAGPALEPRVLDFGLNVLDAETTHISVCSTEPLTFAAAATTNLLGFKAGTAGAMFGAPADGTPTPSRQVASVQISDGAITVSGTASWWAAYSTAGGGTLHAHGTLSGAQVVTNGNTFTLAPFTIKIPGQ